MSSGEAKASLTSPRRSSNSKLDEYRIVHFNSSRVAEHKFCTNKITTYLYSWWNFAPKILFEEFSKLPYMYFLTMTALQCIPIVSNTSGVPTLAPILTIMVCASAALKLIEVRRPAAPPPRLSRPSTPLSPRPTAARIVRVWPLPAPPPRSRSRSTAPAPAQHAPRSLLLACRIGHATGPTKRPTTRRRSASAAPPSSTRSGPTSRHAPHAPRPTPHARHHPHHPHPSPLRLAQPAPPLQLPLPPPPTTSHHLPTTSCRWVTSFASPTTKPCLLTCSYSLRTSPTPPYREARAMWRPKASMARQTSRQATPTPAHTRPHPPTPPSPAHPALTALGAPLLHGHATPPPHIYILP